MTTEIIKINPANPQPELIKKAADCIREGKLVVVPTETVYGLAVNLGNKAAMDRLYEVKGRSKDKPFTIGIAIKEKVEQLAQDILPYAYRLMDKYWPGPLTLVFKAKGQGAVGLRIPNNKVCLAVIDASGVDIALPSANISGHAPTRSAQEVLENLEGKIDLVLDAGQTELGVESTVVDTRQLPLKILREGAVRKGDLEEIANKKRVLFVCTGNSCRSVMAKGLLEKALKEKNINDVEVLSAGISALAVLGPTQETLKLLSQEGIDMSGYRSCPVTGMLLKSSDLILVMDDLHERRILQLAPGVKNRVYLLKEFAKISDTNLNIEDPIGQGIDFYRKVFDTIKSCVDKIVTIL